MGSFNEAGADAPEIPGYVRIVIVFFIHASMRPGRMPRKYPWGYRGTLFVTDGFNEAGADAPEIPAKVYDDKNIRVVLQ